jgi:hypothetical protein
MECLPGFPEKYNESFPARDKAFCVCQAENEDVVFGHARFGKLSGDAAHGNPHHR